MLFPARFEYHAPASVKEAAHLLHEYNEDVRVLAGGQSLIPMMKLRVLRPKHVIDINQIPELSYVKKTNGGLKIGALTRESLIERSETILDACPVLAEASGEIADMQIRSRGTLVGSLCNADPSADYAPVALALDAKMEAFSTKGSRTIEAKDFFAGSFSTSLEPDELVTEVEFPELGKDTVASFAKLSRSFGDFAIVNVASLLRFSDDGICKDARIALGAVASTVRRAREAEKILVGKKLDERVVRDASENVTGVCEATSDIRGSKEYKTEMAMVMTKISLTRVLEEARSRRLLK